MNRPNPDRRSGAFILMDRDAGTELRERELAIELAQARREQERAEAALRESERKYHELVEQAADGIFLVDSQGRFLLANARCREMLGYAESEFIELTLADVHPAGERNDAAAAGLLERTMVRKDGSRFPAEISVRSLGDGTRQGIVRDISARRLQEDKLEKLSRLRSVAAEINAAIVRAPNRQALYHEACRIAVELGRFGGAWIGSFDAVRLALTPVASAGVESDNILCSTQLVFRHEGAPRESALALAVREHRPAYNNDLVATADAASKRRQEAIRRGYHSVIGLPLVVEGSVVATFTLFAREPHFFGEGEVGLLTELAGNLSFALEHMERREKVEYLSYYDEVTGLPNRALFMDRAGQQMRSRDGEPLMVALILINVERFRYINEAFGRRGGDDLLARAARRLEQAFRGKDYIARVGADGFGVVVRGIRDAAAVARIVEEQALGCFREPYSLDGREVRVGAKAGVAVYPADGGDADTLFRNAEAALKRARDTGERCLFYAAEMNARAAQVLSLETRLRIAVERQQFVLHYQPQIGLASGRETICGLEALIRWQEPGRGLVPPGVFISLLEETGLILEVGRWALERALADRRAWAERGIDPPRIAVNVSPIQLQQRDFVDMVIDSVRREGDSANALELEVTENLLMKDVDASIRKLSVLRGAGVHVTMDDFGTGYSSLSYMARLPIDSVKIDRSFISGMATGPQDMAIVTTIIALARSLNLRVVAEGVETREQARLLALLKCDEMQGFLYSRPLPAADIEALLRARSSEAAR